MEWEPNETDSKHLQLIISMSMDCLRGNGTDTRDTYLANLQMILDELNMIKFEELRRMVDEIDEKGEDLTNWEVGFISDIIDRDIKKFSPKQCKYIKEIYEKRV